MGNSKAKVLLIEDDLVLTEMYNLKFKEMGIDLLMAADGLSGLSLAKQELPIVILLDIIMPKMDGFAVLTELKKDVKTKNIPVILLSNLGQKNDIAKGKQLGAADYIVKATMTPSQIVEKVEFYLN
jgi:DNA-binding response OmpR family regulator